MAARRESRGAPVKAVVYTQYGPPEVLQLREIEKPTLKDNEVLIRVHATTVAGTEIPMRNGGGIDFRIVIGLRRPRERYRVLGMEVAGEIESMGKEVTRFKEGDQVYGFTGFGLGGYAEYCRMPEKGSLAIKPANVSYEEAAAVVDGASTALFFLNKGRIRSGQEVLINGASGSIGTYAVQLAKYFGAEVTGVCSTANLELVRSLGADRVIDYTEEDFTESGRTYDIIFDTVGKSSFSRCKGSLKKGGRYLLTVGWGSYLVMLWTSVVGSKKLVRGMSIKKTDELVFLRELIEAGHIRPVIDRRFPLEDIAEAHRYVEAGHKKGNVVITVG
jgi:NADPH:quinone reductase-like Zn-dependent oxidoreductase